MERGCLSMFHIIHWLPTYSKTDFISDLIAGLTIGLTIIPQSLAYASLAGLSTEYGLYSSFMGSFIYVIFGTVKEVSIGPTSLMAILTLSFTKHLTIEYVILLTFLSGCVEFLMGFFKLGFLVDLISAPAISGLTSASTVIVTVSQLKGLLGLNFYSRNVVSDIKNICKNWQNVRIYDLLLGIFCINFLLAFKMLGTFKLSKRNHNLKRILWSLSISKNAIIVILCALFAYILHTDDTNTVFRLSGKVKPGIPEFHFPKIILKSNQNETTFFTMFEQLGLSIIIIPIISVFTSVAIARAFANSMINPSQEMIALGLCNIIGSFVGSMPTCGAFSRSAVSHNSGIKTPMAGIYTGTIVLLSLKYIIPCFYYIPKATLSAILITAVAFMFDYKIIIELWKFSKSDLLVTLCTFTTSLIYGVEVGLLCGTLVNVILLLKIWVKPKFYIILHEDNDINYIVVKPKIGYLFPTANYFIEKICKISNQYDNVPLILDCSNILIIDYTTLNCFKSIVEIFENNNQLIVFINIAVDIKEKLENFLQLNDMQICPNLSSAVDRIFGVEV